MTLARRAAEILAATWSYRVIGQSHLDALGAQAARIVYVVWHGGLLPSLYWHRGRALTVLVSEHRDGSRLAAAIERWGYATVRGSATRGAVRGLLGMVKALKDGGSVAITPDGPRGPARVVKPGAVLAAQRGGAFILPVGAAASRGWELGSWDCLLIPRPFAEVRIAYDTPFRVGPGGGALEDGIRKLQAGLDRATRLAECAA